MDRLVTKTLAEIYLQQGHLKEAYSLFKTLSERDPEDVELKDRLRELEEKMNLLAPEAEFPPVMSMDDTLGSGPYLFRWGGTGAPS